MRWHIWQGSESNIVGHFYISYFIISYFVVFVFVRHFYQTFPLWILFNFNLFLMFYNDDSSNRDGIVHIIARQRAKNFYQNIWKMFIILHATNQRCYTDLHPTRMKPFIGIKFLYICGLLCAYLLLNSQKQWKTCSPTGIRSQESELQTHRRYHWVMRLFSWLPIKC